ncbi:hypothetical protein PanWU01x14_365990 [Parasponia andersonii]|uniref:Uncharacterized protein n=1 Tax=Parasponia andersonii TaxID=3476 RepID=A0A2P5A5S0_PARAD|nr:hypothetical protein PanWU01x14_365990 [Parasponia andersonii]
MTNRVMTTLVPVDDQLAQDVAHMRNERNHLIAREEYHVEEKYSLFTPEIQDALLRDSFKMLTIATYKGKADSKVT